MNKRRRREKEEIVKNKVNVHTCTLLLHACLLIMNVFLATCAVKPVRVKENERRSRL